MGAPVKKNSWEDCSDHCDDEPKCFAWSYFTEQYPHVSMLKHCYMKNADFKNGQKRMIGLTSGTRGCGRGKYYKISINILKCFNFGDHKLYNIVKNESLKESSERSAVAA